MLNSSTATAGPDNCYCTARSTAQQQLQPLITATALSTAQQQLQPLITATARSTAQQQLLAWTQTQ